MKEYDNSVEIDIINPIPVNNKTQYKTGKPYRNIIAYEPLHPLIYKIPKLRGILSGRRLDKIIREVNTNIDRYDVILLHGFWLTSCYIFSKLNKEGTFSIAAFWGSDFYERRDEKQLFSAIDSCDSVVISTSAMEKDILNVKAIDKNKIRNCLFGSAPLGDLFNLQNEYPKQAKEILGFREDDFIIACSYNADPNNQHLKIISALSEIKSALPQHTKVIVPLTYGGTKKYICRIKKALEESQLAYSVYEDFLPDEKVAYIRKASDLLIQVPRVDAFSASMQEHLFAQNIMIAGDWLPYQQLKEKGIYYETINDISELKDKLLFVFQNLDGIKNKVAMSNTPVKFKGSLWGECIKDWHGALSEYKDAKK